MGYVCTAYSKPRTKRLLDPDEYLPPATKDLCSSILKDCGFRAGRPSSHRFVLNDAKAEHRIAYENLCEQLRRIPESEYDETLIPKGGRKWEGFRVDSEAIVRMYREQCDDEYDREKLEAELQEVIATDLQDEGNSDSDTSEIDYWTDDE